MPLVGPCEKLAPLLSLPGVSPVPLACLALLPSLQVAPAGRFGPTPTAPEALAGGLDVSHAGLLPAAHTFPCPRGVEVEVLTPSLSSGPRRTLPQSTPFFFFSFRKAWKQMGIHSSSTSPVTPTTTTTSSPCIKACLPAINGPELSALSSVWATHWETEVR